MKKLLFAILFLTSCTTYKIGQTPDDLYFSGKIERNNIKDIPKEKYQEYISPSDVRFLRMKVNNRNRWSMIDDFNYWNDFRFNTFYLNFNPFFNPYFDPFWYNPFFGNRLFQPYMFGFNPYIYSFNTLRPKQTQSVFTTFFTPRNKIFNNSNYTISDKYRKPVSSSSFDRPSRSFNSTNGGFSSSNGLSGGFRSAGSSSSSSRGGRN